MEKRRSLASHCTLTTVYQRQSCRVTEVCFPCCTDSKFVITIIIIIMPRSFLITNRRYRTSSAHDNVTDDVSDEVSCSPSSSWCRDEESQGRIGYKFASQFTILSPVQLILSAIMVVKLLVEIVEHTRQ